MIRITITENGENEPDTNIEVHINNIFRTGCAMIKALGMAAGDIIEQISKKFPEGKVREGASSILTCTLLDGLSKHDDQEEAE